MLGLLLLFMTAPVFVNEFGGLNSVSTPAFDWKATTAVPFVLMATLGLVPAFIVPREPVSNPFSPLVANHRCPLIPWNTSAAMLSLIGLIAMLGLVPAAITPPVSKPLVGPLKPTHRCPLSP